MMMMMMMTLDGDFLSIHNFERNEEKKSYERDWGGEQTTYILTAPESRWHYSDFDLMNAKK
jgi:hypothetical protein